MNPTEIRSEMERLKAGLDDNKKERQRILRSNPGLKRNRTARKEILHKQKQLIDECPHTNILYPIGRCQDCGELQEGDNWR